MFFFPHIVYCVILIINYSLSEELVIETLQGPVRGYKNIDTGLYEFYGIPYATIPKGTDKFKAPLPPNTHAEVFDATNMGILCPQSLNGQPITYEEDCLIINIFVPDKNITNYSVVAYIHGGAFEAGFSTFWLPLSLAQTDVIGVTFNYRLGAHGFLCLQTEAAPGNAALKDQLAALRWIKQNIRQFGGDPDDVTLAGYSAGSASAEILMLSPTNENLFNKVILESGNGVASFALREDPVEFAKEFAERVGATADIIEDMELLEQFYTTLSFNDMFSITFHDQVSAGFLPCVEKKIENIETIIESNPLEILRKGTYNKLPILNGYTNAEGVLFLENKDAWLEGMAKKFSDYLPPNFSLKSIETEAEVVEKIKALYFSKGFEHEGIGQNFVDYFTDSVFMFWSILSARLHAEHLQKVYLYEFTFAGSLDLYNAAEFGAGHVAQTAYVLNRLAESNLNENDELMRRRVIAMWSNFIKYGEPIPTTSTLLSTNWAALNPENMNYLQIDLEMNEKTWARKEYMEFWYEMWTIKWEETDDSNQVLPAMLTVCGGLLITLLNI